MQIITRFAPSPTGYLHIGGARTALFNYLFAKHNGGKFLLRIEDTDRARSTQGAIDAIVEGLGWLGLPCDGEPIFQFARAARHAEVAKELVAKGAAYYCYMTAEEIETERAAAKADGKMWHYDRRWRNRTDTPPGVSPSIRIRAPESGSITIADKVQGDVTVEVKELDDMVLLRADGTPTYMLAVVVDDHDMGVTHVIRGDDHLTNAFRQTLIYNAMNWSVPQFAHIPLIHGPDGAKLSKRHGAVGIEWYRDQGYLPEALRNYLLRLSWSHGDDEIISDAQAIAWFNLDSIGQSPSRIDFAKLENVNAHYMREADDARLLELLRPLCHSSESWNPALLLKAIPVLKTRANTLLQLADLTKIFTQKPVRDAKAEEAFAKADKAILAELTAALQALSAWDHAGLEGAVKAFLESKSLKFGAVGPGLRALLAGRMDGPGVYELMEVLGKEEALARLGAAS